MKLPDLLALKQKEPKTYLQFAAAQLQGARARQEDYFLNFNDECFAVADGVGETRYGDVAARTAAETAIWAYKLIRQKPYYWSEKKEFIERIFRSTNMTVWQKSREFSGLATTLDVVIVTEHHYWFGHVGDGSIFLYADRTLQKLTHDHSNYGGKLSKYIGQKRLGLQPQVGSGILKSGDVLLITTDGITNALAPEALTAQLRGVGKGNKSTGLCVETIVNQAEQANDADNLTACLIRRI